MITKKPRLTTVTTNEGTTWKLMKLLGTGCYGEVFMGEDVLNPQRKAAIKIFHRDSEESENEFEHELGVAQVIATGWTNGPHGPVPYFPAMYGWSARSNEGFVIAYKMAECDLGSWNEKHPLSADEMIDIYTVLKKNLDEMHAFGYAHRDIHEGNILVFIDEATGKPYFTFGDLGRVCGPDTPNHDCTSEGDTFEEIVYWDNQGLLDMFQDFVDPSHGQKIQKFLRPGFEQLATILYPSPVETQDGTVWNLVGELGVGKSSRVFKGVDAKNPQRFAAIKVFKQQANFERELKNALKARRGWSRRSRHHPGPVPYIVPVYGWSTTPGKYAIAYKMAEGDLLAWKHDNQIQLTDSDISLIQNSIEDILRDLHANGIAHRDVGNERNILVFKNEQTGRLEFVLGDLETMCGPGMAEEDCLMVDGKKFFDDDANVNDFEKVKQKDFESLYEAMKQLKYKDSDSESEGTA